MRILFQGDSITDCYRIKEGDALDLRIGMGYVLLCQAELMCEEPGKYTIMNRGISGNKVTDIYERMKEDIIDLKPDFMSILVGVNDGGHRFAFPDTTYNADEFFEVYCKLIEEVKTELPDIKIVILEPFTLKGKENEKYYEEFREEVEKRAELAKKVAEKYNLTFVPLQEKFDEASKLADNSCWFYDGIHPTAAGHMIIKKEWMKAYKELNL